MSEGVMARAGYQIEIDDRDLQVWLQKSPFAVGANPGQNLAAIEAVFQGLRVRKTGGGAAHRVLLDPGDTSLSEIEQQRLEQMFSLLGMDPGRQRHLIDDFGWEANMAPRTASNVLVVGCGNGMELLFLRAVLPGSKITALDYRDAVSPQVKEITNAEIITGDFNLSLRSLRGFDLISSNHTLEHMYHPETTLRALYDCLIPGGVLISTLPMDANPGSPFLKKVDRMVVERKGSVIDFVFLDAGHPWKTNPSDLDATLRDAGFTQVTLYQRTQHPCRGRTGGKLQRNFLNALGHALHFICFEPVRCVGRALPAGRVQDQARRILLALERRVWFGSNNLKNRFTEETLFYAAKPQDKALSAP